MPANLPRIPFQKFQLDLDDEVYAFKQNIRKALENIPNREGFNEVYKDDFIEIAAEIEDDHVRLMRKKPGEEEWKIVSGGPKIVNGDKIDLGYATMAVVSSAQERSEYLSKHLFDDEREKQEGLDEETEAFKMQIKNILSNITTNDTKGKLLLDNDFFTLLIEENKLDERNKDKGIRDVKIKWIIKKNGKEHSGLLFLNGKEDLGSGKISIIYEKENDEEVIAETFARCFFELKERKKANNNPQVKDIKDRIRTKIKNIDANFKSGDAIYEDEFCKITLENVPEYVLNADKQKYVRFFNKKTQQYYTKDEYSNEYDRLFLSQNDEELDEYNADFLDNLGFFFHLSKEQEQERPPDVQSDNQIMAIPNLRDRNTNQNTNAPQKSIAPAIVQTIRTTNLPHNQKETLHSVIQKSGVLSANANYDYSQINGGKATQVSSGGGYQNTNDIRNNNNDDKKTSQNFNNNNNQNTQEKQSYALSVFLCILAIVAAVVGAIMKNNKTILIVGCCVAALLFIGCVIASASTYKHNKNINNKNPNNVLNNTRDHGQGKQP